MKNYIQLFVAFLFCISVSAQTGSISISGKLINKEKLSEIHLRNIDGVNISIPVTEQNNFSFTTDTLPGGFYDVDEIGITYLSPGYHLNVQPVKNADYLFKGTDALENNNLRTAKKQISTFLPIDKNGVLGELEQSAYYLEVPVFLQKLDSFQKSGKLLFNESKDTFFSKYATLDLEFYSNHLLSLYYLFYGTDLEKLMKMGDFTRQLDFKSPNLAKAAMQVDSFMKAAHKKVLNFNDRTKLAGLVNADWDRSNDILFRNSASYREAFTNFFTSMAHKPKYQIPFTLQPKPADPDIQKLAVVRGEISNPYIRSYFEYTITKSILLATKDTALINKYYNEYLTRASRQDYLQDIKEIYNNGISYTDNMPAPTFSFKDVFDKNISLESFRGKYVYIDVWATWCAPCIAEIPHLKELEIAYHDKNLTFISISVDESHDVNKWKAFVKKNNLQGVQLISDNAFESVFTKKMNINSIPRFILIDPAGKIVFTDALRPSDKELRTYLDKLL